MRVARIAEFTEVGMIIIFKDGEASIENLGFAVRPSIDESVNVFSEVDGEPELTVRICNVLHDLTDSVVSTTVEAFTEESIVPFQVRLQCEGWIVDTATS